MSQVIQFPGSAPTQPAVPEQPSELVVAKAMRAIADMIENGELPVASMVLVVQGPDGLIEAPYVLGNPMTITAAIGALHVSAAMAIKDATVFGDGE